MNSTPERKRRAPAARVAHIVALGDRGPRADSDMPVVDRNDIENLLLLYTNYVNVPRVAMLAGGDAILQAAE